MTNVTVTLKSRMIAPMGSVIPMVFTLDHGVISRDLFMVHNDEKVVVINCCNIKCARFRRSQRSKYLATYNNTIGIRMTTASKSML